MYNFDLPTSIDRNAFYKDISDLFEGKTIHKEEYTFNNPAIKPKMLEIKPAPILIIEGLFIYHYTEVNQLIDHRIFLDANQDIALERRLRRDLIERGYFEEDVRYKWINHVLPSYNEYLLPYKNTCDQVIINNTDDPEPIWKITDDICQELKDKIYK